MYADQQLKKLKKGSKRTIQIDALLTIRTNFPNNNNNVKDLQQKVDLSGKTVW